MPTHPFFPLWLPQCILGYHLLKSIARPWMTGPCQRFSRDTVVLHFSVFLTYLLRNLQFVLKLVTENQVTDVVSSNL